MSDEIIVVTVCFAGRVNDYGLTAKDAFLRLQAWQREPGTSWIKVRISGAVVYDWYRPTH